MSDFPFSIPRTVVAQTPPFSYKQTDDIATISVSKWENATGGDEEKITQLSGLLITPTSASQKVLLQRWHAQCDLPARGIPPCAGRGVCAFPNAPHWPTG